MENPERRQHYRNTPENIDSLQIGLMDENHEPTLGELIDISFGGVRLKFSNTHNIVLPLGYIVQLAIYANADKSPVGVPATIMDRNDANGSRDYGFKFNAPEELRALLAKEFQHHFNQRKAQRVTPDKSNPVALHLKNIHGEYVEGQLIDLSGSGMGAQIANDRDIDFCQLLEIEGILRIPGVPEEIAVNCVISRRSLVCGKIHYGLEFDFDGSEDSRRQKQQVMDYFLQRQSELFPEGRNESMVVT